MHRGKKKEKQTNPTAVLRRRLRSAGMLSLGLSVGGLVFSIASQAADLSSTRAVPAYFSDNVNWAFLESNAAGVEIAVMNPDSGPGVAVDPAWTARLTSIGLSNPRIVGYVDITYGVRPIANVIADIDRYKAWYGVVSIFLDQVPSNCNTNAYLTTLSNKIRANGGIVILNPGVMSESCVLDSGDIIVTFEGNVTDYQASTATNPAGYSPRKFWHLVYAVPEGQQRAIEELARTRSAGFVYATSDLMPNPWSRVDPFPPAPIGSPTTVVAPPPAPVVIVDSGEVRFPSGGGPNAGLSTTDGTRPDGSSSTATTLATGATTTPTTTAATATTAPTAQGGVEAGPTTTTGSGASNSGVPSSTIEITPVPATIAGAVSVSIDSVATEPPSLASSTTSVVSVTEAAPVSTTTSGLANLGTSTSVPVTTSLVRRGVLTRPSNTPNKTRRATARNK